VIEQPIEPVVRAWLPQRFGSGKARRIVDPIIEPLWIGDRVLADVRHAAAEATIVFVTTNGTTLDAHADGDVELAAVADAVLAATAGRATSALIDGYLTRQATRPPAGDVTDVEAPTLADHATRLVVGERRGRRQEVAQDAAAEAAVVRAGTPLAFVAVDLLEIDGTELLDVPLLERKRLLESAIAPGELARVGPYVRPPLDSWLGTWRVAGFVEIAFKAANSRYRPGTRNDDWATMHIPRP
jgi:hypothetical protein